MHILYHVSKGRGVFLLERMLSPEERIRRAEEIYQRKKMQSNGVRVTSRAVNTGTKVDYYLVKKMLLQIAICLTIYIIFYLVSNNEFFFSREIINKTKDILAYDLNFQQMYQDGKQYFEEAKLWVLNTVNKEEKTEEKQEENNTTQTEEKALEEPNPITEENIGGATENSEEQEPQPEKQLSQMEIDAEYIKNTYPLIYPIEGTITSRFGLRNPTTPTVPKNHTGIDIAASVGTVIHAALDGVVTLASSEGDYGNHLKIQKEDVEIVYAHCSKLYLKEGDVVKQGDSIAEVGATGNVTGPHLHFEFRREGRYVDPDLIMSF